jgi:putative sigma-54 modulation protein
MKLRLTARGIETSDELKEFVNRRIRFSLGRLAGKIKGLTIQLSDSNGPRGGVDKCCDIRIDAGLRQEVIVRERRTSIHAALARALDRAEQAVQSQLRLASPAWERSAIPRSGG